MVGTEECAVGPRRNRGGSTVQFRAEKDALPGVEGTGLARFDAASRVDAVRLGADFGDQFDVRVSDSG